MIEYEVVLRKERLNYRIGTYDALDSLQFVAVIEDGDLRWFEVRAFDDNFMDICEEFAEDKFHLAVARFDELYKKYN